MNARVITAAAIATFAIVLVGIGAYALGKSHSETKVHVKHVTVTETVPDPSAEVKGELAAIENIYQQASAEAEYNLETAEELIGEVGGLGLEHFSEAIGGSEAFTDVMGWTNTEEGRLLRAHPELEAEVEDRAGL